MRAADSDKDKWRQMGSDRSRWTYERAWAALMQVVLLVFCLLGLFKKTMAQSIVSGRLGSLVGWTSKLIISYNWYLSAKFALLALLTYELNSRSNEVHELSCLFSKYLNTTSYPTRPGNYTTSSMSSSSYRIRLSDQVAYLTYLVDTFGGPFKQLGNRAALVYSVYSIAFFIMLAIFPLELLCFLDDAQVGYNFIRFVLGHPGCMRALHDKRQRHHAHLDSRSGRTKQLPPGGGTVRLPVARFAMGRGEREWNYLRVPVADNRDWLQDYRPYVRSEQWRKLAVPIYATLVITESAFLALVLAGIQAHCERMIGDKFEACSGQQVDLTRGAGRGADWRDSLSLLDQVTYHELTYTLLVLSSAAGFYASYYFGTVLELSVWLREILQQLALSARLIELTARLGHQSSSGEGLNSFGRRHIRGSRKSVSHSLSPPGSDRVISIRVMPRCRLPGGNQEVLQFLTKSGSREPMSMPSDKQNVLAVTYVNMRLFFDELEEARFMTTTILRRTSILACGLAIVAAMTRSQNNADYWHLHSLLLACLSTLNVYLAGAAYINYKTNKMLVGIHSLISASKRAGQDGSAALVEFFARYVVAVRGEQDFRAYDIYGHKITWGSIIRINYLIFTVYYTTMKAKGIELCKRQ